MSRNGDVPLEYQTAVASYMSFLSLNSSKDQPRFDTVEAASVNAAVCTEGADNAPLGDKFSSAGPAPFKGDILDDPDLLWTEDVWSEEKVLEAQERLKSQGDNLSSFWRKRYESKAGTYWHEFYKRNENHFYKDRHYLHIVFPELLTNSTMPICDSNTYRLLEVGCGVGNAVIPLVDLNPNMQVVAIDFARSAIQILNEHPKVLDGRIAASVCNIVEDILPVSEGSMDGILCMFVLSAVAPAEHRSALTKLYNALKPGGKLFFRDYGRFDEAQLRFKKGSKLDDNFYVRQDGTCSFFFDIEELRDLTMQVGFQCEELEFIRRQYANRQQHKARHRSWVHMKLTKPSSVN